MTDHPTPNDNLADEFQTLGKNLVDAMRAAWESPERKRLQQELTSGLQELEKKLKTETDNFSKSPTSQQLKDDAARIGEKINNAEVTELVRQELIKTLQAANLQLEKIAQRWKSEEQEAVKPNDQQPQEGKP